MPEVPARRPVTAARVRAVDGERVVERPDRVVTEEPMEIRVAAPGREPEPLAVTMRTPGHDFELAVGFLATEGLLTGPDQVVTVAYCLGGAGEQRYNVVTVTLHHPVDLAARRRDFVASASCGLCGATALDRVEVACAPIGSGPRVARAALALVTDRLRDAQAVFDVTGGLHAAAAFGPDGTPRVVREDIGRHNALDKLVGRAYLAGELPLSDTVLVVSGRVSFEIVQKAAVAGIPVVCAVSAPSSLAIAAAQRFGQTLVGFLRDDRFNVYAHPERVDLGAGAVGATAVSTVAGRG